MICKYTITIMESINNIDVIPSEYNADIEFTSSQIFSGNKINKNNINNNSNEFRIISSTKFNAQFSLLTNNTFVTLLSSTCFDH